MPYLLRALLYSIFACTVQWRRLRTLSSRLTAQCSMRLSSQRRRPRANTVSLASTSICIARIDLDRTHTRLGPAPLLPHITQQPHKSCSEVFRLRSRPRYASRRARARALVRCVGAVVVDYPTPVTKYGSRCENNKPGWCGKSHV
ncbi:hypothetical protein PENSPDRAFT_363704 [Peniophora sp. CONT]|nr:hypothetical protein PENSPDRAFT_363704 [Peniophora sp. CONT]